MSNTLHAAQRGGVQCHKLVFMKQPLACSGHCS